MPVSRTFEDSANLRSAEYENGTLRVTFQTGRTYQYSGIPLEVWDNWALDDSPGKFFQVVIRRQFEGVLNA